MSAALAQQKHARPQTFRTCTAKAEPANPMTSHIILFKGICGPHCVPSTIFRIHAYAYALAPIQAGARQACGTHLLCRHSLKPALAGGMRHTITLEAISDAGNQKKHLPSCTVAYCKFLLCNEGTFCSSSSTGGPPKPTSSFEHVTMLMDWMVTTHVVGTPRWRPCSP